MSGGVLDGQDVDAAITNPAFIIKNADDTTPSRLGLGSVLTAQGPAITWAQQQLNSILSFLGQAANGVYNVLPTWVTNNFGASTDTVFARVKAIDAAFGATDFTIVNNQASPANVTGLVFSGSSVRSFQTQYQIYRNTTSTGATELAEAGVLTGVYSTVAGSWQMTQQSVGNAGVTFTITTAGQVQYTSTNITGTPASSDMKFKSSTIGV